MGASNSRPTLRKQTSQADSETSSNNLSFRRLSKTRLSKADRANAISINIQNVRKQVEQFDGFRGDSRYQSIQSELTKFSQEVQDVKGKAKPATKDVCSNIQADIVDLLRKLEEIVERNEGELDLAAVESHSFIDQTPKANKRRLEPVIIEEPPQKSNIDRDRTMMSLTQLEESTATLMKEINRAIELESTSEFVVFEKKIGILYADLTAMDIEQNDPLHERKESVSRKLIRYNNKLKTHKNRSSTAVNKEQDKTKKAEQELLVINQIEENLVDIEVKVMMFEDVKGDPKYRELDQILKGYWAKLQSLDDSSEDNRRKKMRTINLIKTNLQALNSKAEENSTKIKAALHKINNLEEDVLALKVVVDSYQGFKNDLDYTNVDQTIRSLWAKLNDVHSTNAKVEQKKNETIKTIQTMLTTLAQNAEKYEAKVAIGREKLKTNAAKANSANNKEESKDDKLVGELSEFEVRWKRLSSDIEKYLTVDNQDNVESVLKTVQNDIDSCIKKLPDKVVDTRHAYSASTSNIVSDYQNQSKKNRASVAVSKIKDEKSKSKTKSNFQPQELLIEELSASHLNQKMPPYSASVVQIIDEIEILQDRLKVITDEIQNSSPSECNELKKKLEDVENDLNNVETNLNPVVTESKTEVFKTIESMYKMIEEKSKKDGKEETAKLKVIIENLQRLKKKVDCFSGTHGNIQFVQIQKELNDCMTALNNIDCKGNEKLQSNKNQINQKINHYMNILDERSLKVSSEENLIAEIEKESFVERTNKLVDKLSEIRSKLENYEANKNHNFEKNIRDARIMLDHIEPKTEEDIKNADYYKEYLNQLITYYQSKVTDASPLSDLEQIVNKLKQEATELDSVIMDNQSINQRIATTMTQIRNLPAEGESKTLKAKLTNDIKTIAALLQTKDTILKDLDRVLEDINKFNGANYKKTYDAIDAKLSDVFLKVEEIPVNSDEEYLQLRNNLIKLIQNHKKLLNGKMTKAKGTDSDLDGTEV